MNVLNIFDYSNNFIGIWTHLLQNTNMKQLDNWMTGAAIKITTSSLAKYSLIIINFGQLQM